MALAGQYDFRETSGYRSAAGNTKVGGVPFSAHRFWLGQDVILDIPGQFEEFKEAARRLGLLAIDEGDHVHIQSRDWVKG